MRTLHVSANTFEHDRWILYLSWYQHRRDTCDDPRHTRDNEAERARPWSLNSGIGWRPASVQVA